MVSGWSGQWWTKGHQGQFPGKGKRGVVLHTIVWTSPEETEDNTTPAHGDIPSKALSV